jgi:CheY-like chemotaxis protein
MSGVDFATRPAAGDSARSKLRSLRILIVDDNKPFAETLSWVLQGAGDLTEICHNGPSALETARTFDPDIIFLDIILPVIDGYEVCKQLRAQTQRENLLIVAQSGIGDTALEAAQRGACFDIHLGKPVDLRQVVSIVNDTRQALRAQKSRKH